MCRFKGPTVSNQEPKCVQSRVEMCRIKSQNVSNQALKCIESSAEICLIKSQSVSIQEPKCVNSRAQLFRIKSRHVSNQGCLIKKNMWKQGPKFVGSRAAMHRINAKMCRIKGRNVSSQAPKCIKSRPQCVEPCCKNIQHIALLHELTPKQWLHTMPREVGIQNQHRQAMGPVVK